MLIPHRPSWKPFRWGMSIDIQRKLDSLVQMCTFGIPYQPQEGGPEQTSLCPWLGFTSHLMLMGKTTHTGSARLVLHDLYEEPIALVSRQAGNDCRFRTSHVLHSLVIATQNYRGERSRPNPEGVVDAILLLICTDASSAQDEDRSR